MNKPLENELKTFATRLRWARIKEKISIEELCVRIGHIVSKQTISKYETGLFLPSREIQEALSLALHTSVDSFAEVLSPEIESVKISFRKRSTASAKDIAALKIIILEKVEKYIQIEKILKINNNIDIPSLNKLILSQEDAVEHAKYLRESWGLGRQPISNTLNLMEQHGIKVILLETSEKFDGISGKAGDNNPFVVLNDSQNNIERRRLTTLHELGHLLMNEKFSSTLKDREKEQLCNIFATEMLIPTESLVDIFSKKKKITIYDLIEVSAIYGISIDALVYRLHNLNIIGERYYRWHFLHKSKDKCFKDIVEKNRYGERDSLRYKILVIKAYKMKEITKQKLMDYLPISKEEIMNV